MTNPAPVHAPLANPPDDRPRVSVIVLNYNGARWLERCLRSLETQTLFPTLEILVADNASPDGSDRLAARLMAGWSKGRVIQHGTNLGYCEGNNRAARQAQGDYLFFLNNDTWLEPGCIEELLAETRRASAQASCPLVLEYDSDDFQSMGAAGFDVFGFATTRNRIGATAPVFMPEGCAYLIERRVFEELGGFDPEFFMYADEFDLSWRLWRAGYQAVAVPQARLHHRGAAQVNPAGGGRPSEFRTSDDKRYYANRNGLLAVLKNAGNALLLLAPLQAGLLALEALAGLVIVRRWSFVRRAYWEAFRDVWRLRRHILEERSRLGASCRRSDIWLLRFLRLRPNRWDEIQRVRRFGLPRVSQNP